MPSDFIEANFKGKVHFSGHHGLLDLTISNPTIKKEGNQWKLYATVTSLPFNKDDVPKALANPHAFKPSGDFSTMRVAIATLSEPKRTVVTDSAQPEMVAAAFAPRSAAPKKAVGENATLTFATVKLTDEGARAFSDFYDPGLVIDPITVNVASSYVKQSETPAPEKQLPSDDNDGVTPSEDTQDQDHKNNHDPVAQDDKNNHGQLLKMTSSPRRKKALELRPRMRKLRSAQ